MRRFFSVVLFVLGGWMLLGEMMMAFIDIEPGFGDTVYMIGFLALFAGVPLLLGAAVSPGQRWRELGLTMLICVAFVLFTAISAAFVFLDPAMARYMPMDQFSQLKPNLAVGIANLLVVAVAGWWLYRRGGGPEVGRAGAE